MVDFGLFLFFILCLLLPFPLPSLNGLFPLVCFGASAFCASSGGAGCDTVEAIVNIGRGVVCGFLMAAVGDDRSEVAKFLASLENIGRINEK